MSDQRVLEKCAQTQADSRLAIPPSCWTTYPSESRATGVPSQLLCPRMLYVVPRIQAGHEDGCLLTEAGTHRPRLRGRCGVREELTLGIGVRSQDSRTSQGARSTVKTPGEGVLTARQLCLDQGRESHSDCLVLWKEGRS
jgi:hypothetical protein